jgi:hypothetical protein
VQVVGEVSIDKSQVTRKWKIQSDKRLLSLVVTLTLERSEGSRGMGLILII